MKGARRGAIGRREGRWETNADIYMGSSREVLMSADQHRRYIDGGDVTRAISTVDIPGISTVETSREVLMSADQPSCPPRSRCAAEVRGARAKIKNTEH